MDIFTHQKFNKSTRNASKCTLKKRNFEGLKNGYNTDSDDMKFVDFSKVDRIRSYGCRVKDNHPYP